MRDRIELTGEEPWQLYSDLFVEAEWLEAAGYVANAVTLYGWCVIIWDRLNQEEP